MLLSEMFGVKRDVDFEVTGYIGRFIIRERPDGTERLWWRRLKDTNVYVNADLDVVYDIILKAPSGITHLPPPITDEQREQLKALYTLEFKFLIKNNDGGAYAYRSKPNKTPYGWYVGEKFKAQVVSWLSIYRLVSWSDPEPFDIGKALGVTE